MKKIKGVVRTNKVGSDSFFEVYVDDDATEEEINEAVWQAVCENIDYGWDEQ